MTAAEKYAALEAAGASVPKCECHGEPMSWKQDLRKTTGGYWGCVKRKRENSRRWYEANREKRREQHRRWYEANREWALDYWHRADGGYIRRRKRELAEQRGQVIAQLIELQKEMVSP